MIFLLAARRDAGRHRRGRRRVPRDAGPLEGPATLLVAGQEGPEAAPGGTSSSSVPCRTPACRCCSPRPTSSSAVAVRIVRLVPLEALSSGVPVRRHEGETGRGLRYSNYRFTKRWIKDALVTEGLIEKVYKNNELDATIEAAIKDALVKLEAIDKYKP